MTTLQQGHYMLRKMKGKLFMRCNELVRLSSWQHRSDLGALIRSRNLSARSLPLGRQLSAVMEGLQYSVTTKGKAAVIYRGYRYRVKKSVDTTVYWQCLEPGCLGRLKTNALGVTPGGQHTHPPFCGKSMRLGKHAQYSTTFRQKLADDRMVFRLQEVKFLVEVTAVVGRLAVNEDTGR